MRLHDEVFKVRGLAWMDHEFGTSQLSSEQIGWDWFSLQLDNQFEIMLYQLRRKDDSLDRNSAGTVVFPGRGGSSPEPGAVSSEVNQGLDEPRHRDSLPA